MNTKLELLEKLLNSRGRAAVALSGGLDSSTLLAFCAKTLGKTNCLAITANLPYSMGAEIADAKNLCASLGVKLLEIRRDEIPVEIENNPPDRCYLCKRAIFSELKSAAIDAGFPYVCDGTNADDVSDYRPGMKALKELEIASPLLECGIGKLDLRALAREMRLEAAEKSAFACLLTRLEHGRKIDTATLAKIDAFETFMRANFTDNVRARVEGESVRIECPQKAFVKISENAEAVSQKAYGLGFKRCSLDLGGYKRGSMNKIQQ